MVIHGGRDEYEGEEEDTREGHEGGASPINFARTDGEKPLKPRLMNGTRTWETQYTEGVGWYLRSKDLQSTLRSGSG